MHEIENTPQDRHAATDPPPVTTSTSRPPDPSHDPPDTHPRHVKKQRHTLTHGS